MNKGRGAMRLILAATLATALAGPAYAQFDGFDVGHSNGAVNGIAKPRIEDPTKKNEAEKAYKDGINKIPTPAAKKVDPWGTVRDTGNGKAANK
jgi:hypothetical protein